MARLTRLALVPLALAAAAAPAIAQADAGTAGAQSGTLLDSVGSMKVYPLAGTQMDPLSNAVNATVAGVPLKSVGVSQMFADGMPVRDLPVYSNVMKANDSAQAVGDSVVAADRDTAPGAGGN